MTASLESALSRLTRGLEIAAQAAESISLDELRSVTVEEAAKIIGVCRRTISDMCKDGRLVKNDVGRVTLWSIRDYQKGLRPRRKGRK